MDIVGSSQPESETVRSVHETIWLLSNDLPVSEEKISEYRDLLYSPGPSSPDYSPWVRGPGEVIDLTQDKESLLVLEGAENEVQPVPQGSPESISNDEVILDQEKERCLKDGLCTYAEKSNFRCRGTHYMLTVNSIPDNCEPEDLMAYYSELDRARKGSKKPDFVLAAVEIGKTGYRHAHVYLRFPTSKMVKNGHALCFPFEENRHHVNIKVVRAGEIPTNVKYCMKDGNYVCSSTVVLDQLLMPMPGKTKPLNVLTKRLLSGCSVEEVVDEDNCHLVMQNLPKLYDFVNFVKSLKERKTEPLKFPFVHAPDFSEEMRSNMKIAAWINDNMLHYAINKEVRPIKTANLWIVSPANCGKTTLAVFLSKFFKVFFFKPESGKQFWPRDLESYDLIHIDEFHGQIPFAEFKRLTDGSPCSLDVKNGQQFLRKRNIPILITTNNWPNDIYRNVYDKLEDADDQIRARFTIIDIKNTLSICIDEDLKKEEKFICGAGTPYYEVVTLLDSIIN